MGREAYENEKKHILGILFSLVLALGLMPGVSLTAYAYEADYYESLKNTEVKFANNDWYLIFCDDSIVTLLSKNCVTTSKYAQNNGTNSYSDSIVKGVVDDWFNSKISDDLKTAVSGGEMFLLTAEEAKVIPQEVRTCSSSTASENDGWWLCSQGDTTYRAAGVFYNGTLHFSKGFEVYKSGGVRPALKLDLSKVVFNSTTKEFSLSPEHTHNFTYYASGGTITATCSETNCSLLNDKTTLTIAEPSLKIYGGDGSASAALNGLDDFNAATGQTIAVTDIMYVGRAGTTYGKSTTAPTNAGKYTAMITVEGKAASVDYEIDKVDPIASAPIATATYGQNHLATRL